MKCFKLVAQRFFPEKTYNKKEVEWRRNHIAETLGNVMFVHGGIDEAENFLSDFWILEFSTLKWNRVDYRGKPPPALAYHSSAVVIDHDRLVHPLYSIYRTPDVPADKNIGKKVTHEGLYIFGGMDEERNCRNDLRILKIGRRPVEWYTPKINGTPPTGRINAQLNFYNDLQILILHGGRNDKDKRLVFNDIFVLDLIAMTWIKTGYTSNIPKDRTEHKSVIYGDKLIIFGGINSFKYLPTDLCIFNLDFQSNKKGRRDTLEYKMKVNDNVFNIAEKTENKRSSKSNLPRLNTVIDTTPVTRKSMKSFNTTINSVTKEITPLIDASRLKDLIRFTGSYGKTATEGAQDSNV